MNIKIKDIELDNISRYRGELMGAAMLFVILFHVGLERSDSFYGLRRMGNVGVDMFLFLSGIGLWFSWTKKPSVKHFFYKRFVRVYPAWLIMACLYYIPDFINNVGRSYSHNIPELIANITFNLSFWRYDDLAFWYIPAIMMMYLFAPAYMKLIIKHPVYRWLPAVFIMWCILVQWVTPINNAVGHIEIFWSRIPIFLIGINFGDAVKKKQRLEGSAIWLVLLLFFMTFSSCFFLEQKLHGQFPIYEERMLYIPLTITAILLLNRIFRRTPKWFNRFCKFIGAMSLEAYLIHLHFVMHYITPYRLGYWTTALLTIAITIPLAWLLHTSIDFVIRKIER